MTIVAEVDSVIEATSQDAIATLKSLSLDQTDQPKRYLAEITVSTSCFNLLFPILFNLLLQTVLKVN